MNLKEMAEVHRKNWLIYGVLKTMVFMHALAMKELLIGVKWYMNESDKKCYSRYVSEVP